MGSRFFGSGRCSIVDVENEDTRTPPPAVAEPSGTRPKFDLVLVSCVKSKLAAPAAAKDLYTSSLFKKERGYAERSGRPWFILSAEHGLVAPDEWLAPYERYLADTTAEFRTAWGAWVAARLELLVGPLTGMEIEVHASSTYLNAVRPHLERLGAHLLDPLRGLDMGQCLAWYPADACRRTPSLSRKTSHSSSSLHYVPLMMRCRRMSFSLREGRPAIPPAYTAGG
ncbi:hypothetical protein BN970_01526 [Mycolicibacterium conceptionense]|uniref:DUF6884 domain-containing protein n=1 Tax=Mycolicibacterium conceptionense TaxID=451644 RepID=A0A0U1D7G3_9MYCO|nr:hypothetical protein BN970_01526 [Mycolicibacterium conceptionense]